MSTELTHILEPRPNSSVSPWASTAPPAPGTAPPAWKAAPEADDVRPSGIDEECYQPTQSSHHNVRTVFRHWEEPRGPMPERIAKSLPSLGSNFNTDAGFRLRHRAADGAPLRTDDAFDTADDLDTARGNAAEVPGQHQSMAETAATGFHGVTGPLPHYERIQAAFGPHHQLSGVLTSVGGAAGNVAAILGARAFTIGNQIGFREWPDLRLAAHEAAHVAQKRPGVHLKEDIGDSSEPMERNADEVADRVVQGNSAADLLPDPDGATRDPSESGADSQPSEPIASGEDSPPEPKSADAPKQDEAEEEQTGEKPVATDPPTSQPKPDLNADELNQEEQSQAENIIGRHLHYEIWVSEAKEFLSKISEDDLQQHNQLIGPNVAALGLRLRRQLCQSLDEFKRACRGVLRLPTGQTEAGERRVRDAMRRLHSDQVDYRDFLKKYQVEAKIRCEKGIEADKVGRTIAGLELISLSFKYTQLKMSVQKMRPQIVQLEQQLQENMSQPWKAGARMMFKTIASVAIGYLKKADKALKYIITGGKILLSDNWLIEGAKESGSEIFEHGVKKSAQKFGASKDLAHRIGEYGAQLLDFLVDFRENWEKFSNELGEFKRKNQQLNEQLLRLNQSRLELVDKMMDVIDESHRVTARYNQSLKASQGECGGVDGGFEQNRAKVQVPGFDY